MAWVGSAHLSASRIGGPRPAGCGSGQERLGAWFAGPPPVAGAGHGAGEHPHAHHYHASRAPTGLLLTIGAVALAAGIIALGVLARRAEPPTFAELKAKLGIPGDAQPGAVFKLSEADFMNRLGPPRSKEEAPQYLYLYYYVQEGMAVIQVDRGGWEAGEARIRSISLR